jgi:hypothetical protein
MNLVQLVLQFKTIDMRCRDLKPFNPFARKVLVHKEIFLKLNVFLYFCKCNDLYNIS